MRRIVTLVLATTIGFLASVFASVALFGMPIADAHHNRTSNPLVGWGSSDPEPSAWSYYDRKDKVNSGTNLDWPSAFFFSNDAETDRISTKLGAAGYDKQGLNKHMWVIARDGDSQWESNAGKKARIDFTCPGLWGEHMRLYGPTNSFWDTWNAFYHTGYGYMVIGTAHLDLDDWPYCANPRYGFPEVAENWFIAPMNTVSGWTINYAQQAHWANSSTSHSVVTGSTIVYYGNDGVQTNVIYH